jgi:UDPglucose 6-dehydrogenase
MIEKINKIEKVRYSGFVYNLEVEPTHDTKDDQYYLNADTGFVVHNCHPRDNIALRYLADRLDLGYDLFDAIMHAREIQAENMAKFVHSYALDANLPVYIHGKAYKPDVAYLEGSYSLLVGHFLEQMGAEVHYIDPLTEPDVPRSVYGVVLLAHNKQITYGYAGVDDEQPLYCTIEDGSVIIDPWRLYNTTNTNIKVVHYGNTRISKV